MKRIELHIKRTVLTRSYLLIYLCQSGSETFIKAFIIIRCFKMKPVISDGWHAFIAEFIYGHGRNLVAVTGVLLVFLMLERVIKISCLL